MSVEFIRKVNHNQSQSYMTIDFSYPANPIIPGNAKRHSYPTNTIRVFGVDLGERQQAFIPLIS